MNAHQKLTSSEKVAEASSLSHILPSNQITLEASGYGMVQKWTWEHISADFSGTFIPVMRPHPVLRCIGKIGDAKEFVV